MKGIEYIGIAICLNRLHSGKLHLAEHPQNNAIFLTLL